MFLEHVRSGEINVALGGRVRYTDGERRVVADGWKGCSDGSFYASS